MVSVHGDVHLLVWDIDLLNVVWLVNLHGSSVLGGNSILLSSGIGDVLGISVSDVSSKGGLS